MNSHEVTPKELKTSIADAKIKVVCVPHEKIKYHNACYNVEIEGKKIVPPAAQSLGIPLNEIWISEKWKKYELYILYHEWKEISFKVQGFSGEKAHLLSQRECIRLWKDDPLWREGLVKVYIQDILTATEDI